MPKTFAQYCNFMGITKTRTTSYHPQCDGQTERQNRTIQAMLSAFASNRRDDWDLWLDSATFAYNISKHDALGFHHTKWFLVSYPDCQWNWN